MTMLKRVRERHRSELAHALERAENATAERDSLRKQLAEVNVRYSDCQDKLTEAFKDWEKDSRELVLRNKQLANARAEPPDKNCYTTPDGDCHGGPCMHNDTHPSERLLDLRKQLAASRESTNRMIAVAQQRSDALADSEKQLADAQAERERVIARLGEVRRDSDERLRDATAWREKFYSCECSLQSLNDRVRELRKRIDPHHWVIACSLEGENECHQSDRDWFIGLLEELFPDILATQTEESEE